MGHTVSKVFKFKTEDEPVVTDHDEEVTNEETGQVLKTPITFRKLNYKTEAEDKPAKSKLLKNIKLDPRSPTVGIYRTPIFVEDMDSSIIPDNCDSPISMYSFNNSDFAAQDIMTPIEPPPNVSGFEESEVEDDFKFIKNLDSSDTPKTVTLKVSTEPVTTEAKKLLHEMILSNENFIKKGKKRELKTALKPEEKGKNDIRSNNLKCRTPLSNITSSTNSPSQLIHPGKVLHNKVLPEFGSENAVSPKVQHVAQWDKNHTIVI